MLIAKYTCNASGVVPTFNSGYTYEISEVESEGIYTVEITSESDFSSCNFNDRSELLTVEYLKVTSKVTSMHNMFINCKNLTSLNVSNWDTSKVTTMYATFHSCINLTSLDLSNFDTSNVKNMFATFYNCNNLTSLDVSNFDTNNVTTMNCMFNSCTSLTSLDLSNFDTSNVTDMQYMFNGCTNLTSLDVSDFDANKVTNMSSMFKGCNNLTTLDLSNFDTSKVTNMSNMFENCNNLTSLDVSNFNTNKVTNMGYIFRDCKSLISLDVSNFDTTNVINIYCMFQNCNNLTSLDVSNFDTSNATNMNGMFANCYNLTSIDVGNFDTSKVTSMNNMFYNCNKLTSLDLSNFNTSEVTNMGDMFDGCKNLTSLDVSNFNTSKVTNMANMFYNCSNLTQLNLSNWNTSSVNNMVNMFYNCNKLTSLDLSNFNTSNVTSMGFMFSYCNNLTSIGLIYANIDTINKLPTLSISTIYIDANIDQIAYTGSSKLEAYEQRTVTINIPTALRSNAEIADRIYWNDEDKHYYIEQNINPNTNETLETPNIIASGVKQPIYLKIYENMLSVGIQNIDASYMSINVPFFEIPTDYEYKWEDELDYIKQSFELRYPDEDDVPNGWGFMGCDNEEGTGLKALIDWVDNCKDEEFVADFDKHFLKDYMLRYYCLVILIGAVDNLGKNMMLDTADNKIFFSRFYDIDTICSYDNSGQLKFDVDIEMEQGYWNTSTSRLWTRMRELMHDDIVATYNNMRQNGISYENMMKYIYDEQIAKIPQTYYLKDYDVKYAPFADSYIGMANGDTYEHAKRWLTQRFRFCDSLFDYAPSYNNDVLTIRANTTELMTLEIETYTPVYQHLSWYNNQMDKKKIDGKVATEFSGKAMAATDQEVLIYGGSNVKSIKGIQSMNPNRMLIGSATRLTELDASNCPLLNDINANKANLSPHTYLNKLNLENCPLLDGNLRLNASPLIREINIKGTNISGLNLPSSLRSLEVMKLPKTLTGFTLNDATSLHTLDFEEGVVLNDVSMTNCNALTNVTNFDLSNAQQVTLNNSYNATNELYFKNASTLSLSNMDNLEKVIYTPNAEHETFDITNLANTKDYNITTFNCPKLTTFMTTAPYRESYGKEYGEVKPNEVFEANSIDISNTQFTDVKLLCTTDTNILKLPQTVKNLIVDSAYDLDTDHLTDGDYDTIHTELYEPYNTNYEGEVTKIIMKESTYLYDDPRITNERTDYIPVNPNSFFKIYALTILYNLKIYEYDKDKVLIQTNTNPNMNYNDSSHSLTVSSNTYYVVCELPYNKPGYTQSGGYKVVYEERVSPNLIPSASDGSIIQSMYVPTKTVQPASGVWDLKGLELEEYHTFGLNNDVKVNEKVQKHDYLLGNTDGLRVRNNYVVREYEGLTSSTGRTIQNICTTSEYFYFRTNDGSKATYLSYTPGQASSTSVLHVGIGTSVTRYSISIMNTVEYVEFTGEDSGITYRYYINDIATTSLSADRFDPVPVSPSETQLEPEIITTITMPDRYDEYSLSIKNKTVKNEIARYTASDWNTFPTFNSGFTYTYDITKLDEVYEYSIMADSMDNLPTQISFNGKSSLLTVEYLNVDNVTNMANMFYNCKNLTSLDLSNWDTINVTRMDNMFQNCRNLTSLDVSNFDTSNVTNMINMFNGCSNLTSLDVSNFDTKNVTSMQSMFSVCKNLASLDLSNFNTSKVTTMANMFNDCQKLTSITFGSNFNTSKVKDMGWMFWNCINLASLDLSNFNTSEVTTMASMFQYCKNLTTLNVSNWNTNNVTNMINMFYGCNNLTSLNLSNFNASNVTSMTGMFNDCNKLTSITFGSNWNTSNVTDMSYMFNSCNNLTSLDVSNFNTNNVTNMTSMFQGCTNLTSIGDVSNWDTSEVTTMNSMFHECKKLTSLDLSNFNTSEVTSMKCMFYSCQSLTSLDVSNFNTSNVTSMNQMFYNCANLTSLDLNNWNTSKVTDMYRMFYYCVSLQELHIESWLLNDITQTGVSTLPVGNDEKNEIYASAYFTVPSGWVLINILEIAKYTCDASGILPTFNDEYSGYSTQETENEGIYTVRITTNSMDNLPTQISFNGKSGLLTVEYLNVDNVTNMNFMFYNCTNLTSLDVSGWDVGNVTNMSYMFDGCKKLTSLDVGDWDVRNVTNMHQMFRNCNNLTSLDLSKWDTTELTDMGSMFQNCTKLTSLDLSNFDTSKATSTDCMFDGCTNLTSLDVSKWDTTEVTYMAYMFRNCQSLTSLDLSNFNTSNVTNMGNMFQGCPNLTSLDLSNFDTSNVTNMQDMFYGCSSLQELHIESWVLNGTTQTGVSSLPVGDDVKNEIYATAYFTVPSGWTLKYSNLYDIAIYTSNASGVLPTFNTEYTEYSVEEIDNGDGTYTTYIRTNDLDVLPTQYIFSNKSSLLSVEKLKVTSKVTNMKDMFKSCYKLTSLDVSNWDTSEVTNMNGMFNGCSGLQSLNVLGWVTSKVTDMNSMFSGCNKLTSLDVSNWDTSEVTNMSYMFYDCSQLTSLDISSWVTSKVTNMSYMFYMCKGLTTLGLSNFDTSKVTNMSYMFYTCSGLTTLDLSNFDTSKVTVMGYMFRNCTNLTTLDLSNFNTSKVTDMGGMFRNCSNLTSLDSMQNISVNLDLSPTSLNVSSLLDVINNLATVTTTKTLTLSSTLLAKLTEEQIAIAVNKGWNIS